MKFRWVDGSVCGDTLNVDIETHPGLVYAADYQPANHVLTFDGNGMVWTGVGSINQKIQSMRQNFIEHFDICGPSAAKVCDAIDKKHSNRTDEEKEIIRNLMKEDKAEKPKINISHAAENVGVQWMDGTTHVVYGAPLPVIHPPDI